MRTDPTVLADLEEICDELVVIKKGNIIFSGDIAGFRRQMRSTTRWRVTAVTRPISMPPRFHGDSRPLFSSPVSAMAALIRPSASVTYVQI